MIKIEIQEHLQITIEGVSGIRVNLKEITELFKDYFSNNNILKKNQIINFYEVTDHLFNYKYLGSKKSKLDKTMNELIFKII